MSYILKRGDQYYKHFQPSGHEHDWTPNRDDAWFFTFRSVPENMIICDPRLAGAEIEEKK